MGVISDHVAIPLYREVWMVGEDKGLRMKDEI